MMTEYKQAIETHRRRVFTFACYSLRAREDAEDITQDVFIKLWQNWQKIDQQKMGAWLMRVTHNAVIDHVRKNRIKLDKIDSYEDVEQQADFSKSLSLNEQERFKTQLQLAIGTLEEPFKSILIMRDIQGLSYEQVQQCLDLSQSQVKVYLHRARRKLREKPELRQLAEDQLLIKSSSK